MRVPEAGPDETRLIILRGNSASGKSSTAAEIRRRYGLWDLAVVGQDNLRRDVLREHDVPGGANIELIGLVARYALNHGFNTIVEGILCTAHYAEMLTALIDDHGGLTCCYYFDVPFDETLRRHTAKPQAKEYGVAEMRGWYRELDLLPGGIEQIIPAQMPQDKIVRRIMADSGLIAEAAQEGWPAGQAEPRQHAQGARFSETNAGH
jgi:predicted kinase